MLNLTSNRKWQPQKMAKTASPAQYHQALIAIVLKQRVASPYHLYDDGKCLWKEADVTHKKAQYAMFCTIISVCLQAPRAIRQLPPATLGALQKLGADLAVARLRRKESLRTWAKRLGVTLSTLQRLEAGDPPVSIGIIASALWLINRDGERWETWRHQKQDLGRT
jgi:hypothetical protein